MPAAIVSLMVGAVAALVEPRARRIEQQRHRILEDGKLHLVDRARLGENLLVVDVFKPPHDRALDDRLAVGHAEQLGIPRPALHRELVVHPDEVLPRQRGRPVEKLGERLGAELPDHDSHPFGGAQPDVRLGDHREVPLKGPPPVRNGDVFPAELFDLEGEHALKPKEAGAGNRHFFIHGGPFRPRAIHLRGDSFYILIIRL